MKNKEFPNKKRAGTEESFARSLDRPARPFFLRPRTDVRGRFEGKTGEGLTAVPRNGK